MIEAHRNLRPIDTEALQRLRDRGPLTIPQAYDCGHRDHEVTGHGMNRLVSAGYTVFCRWDADRNDALWMITQRGRKVLAGIKDG